ncbi:MAG: SDR family oxidoreductase [Chlamydiales bacterium]|nr:SDR family oxidoreductase [Chlamydiales bacterium]
MESTAPNLPPLKILKGQKALVTGASSGIGQAIAIGLGEAGCDVLVNYGHHEEGALEAVAKIEAAGSKAIACQADVGQEDQIIKMFQTMKETFGRIDILVNNAGLQRDHPVAEMTADEWNKVISVNLTGQFISAREAIKHFREQGIDPKVSCSLGKIICISSVHQIIPWAGHVNYASSKGGIHMMMQSLAQEVAGEKIRINAIGPGAIRTKINTAAWDTKQAYENLMKLIPYDRIGEPEDIARTCAFLASDYADYITGVTLFVDGGMTLFPGFRTGG